MAGIYREWTNEDMAQSANTFAIVTGNGNELTNQVHNTKKRMPTILTQELAEEWISKDLPKERVIEIASFRYDANEMFTHPVSKDFLYSDEPEKEFYYPELPALEKW
jgi:putative SOS response-associated peptidase YedK